MRGLRAASVDGRLPAFTAADVENGIIELLQIEKAPGRNDH
ncbi:hypothetical protein [Rhodoferax sp.]|nr:hypothetical protein [Rhodoferax sp.]MDZ7919991.1 hypothetical protein [Rhodoferax sp.]